VLHRLDIGNLDLPRRFIKPAKRCFAIFLLTDEKKPTTGTSY